VENNEKLIEVPTDYVMTDHEREFLEMNKQFWIVKAQWRCPENVEQVPRKWDRIDVVLSNGAEFTLSKDFMRNVEKPPRWKI
jgi:hypothetical protein